MIAIKLTKSLNPRVYFGCTIVIAAGIYGASSYPDVYDDLFIKFLVSVISAPFALLYLIMNFVKYLIAPKFFTLDIEQGLLCSEGKQMKLSRSQFVKMTYIFKRFSLSIFDGDKKLIKTGAVYTANLSVEDIRNYCGESDRLSLSEYY